MSIQVERHFATLQGRQVHYRRAGRGAPVLLLHQTPTSSAELLPLMHHLAPRFTVIAPDMPGYGASDPLGTVRGIAPTPSAVAPVVTVDALADGLAQFMSALSIEAAGIYGFHTGASVATAMARRHPARVVVAVTEGLLCLDAAERDEWIARYLEPFVPRWDGSHLCWLWSRLKDQSVFFPWYERSSRGRLAIDATDTAALAAKALDWLCSGERYHLAYRAAMLYDPRADIARIATPHHVVIRQGDPLAGHLERLPPLPSNVRVEVLAGGSAGMARIGEILGAHCPGLRTPPPPSTSPIDDGIWQEYIGRPGAQLRVLRAGDAAARPLVVQHDAQSSAVACAALIAGFASTRAVYGVDLPGHGLSDAAAAPPDPSMEQLADTIQVALADRVERADHIGIGAGAGIVVELARAMRARDRSHAPWASSGLTLIAPIDLSGDDSLRQALAASYTHAPSDSHGGYLLKAWHEVRDHQLFFPWFERRRACGTAAIPALSPQWLQEQTVAHVLSGANGVALRSREAHYPLLHRLRGCKAAVRFAAPECSARRAHLQALLDPAVRWVPLPDSMSEWASLLAAWPATGQTMTSTAPGGARLSSMTLPRQEG